MTFLAILRILLPPFDQLGIAGILFQQVFMLANRYLVVMDIDDLVQLLKQSTRWVISKMTWP